MQVRELWLHLARDVHGVERRQQRERQHLPGPVRCVHIFGGTGLLPSHTYRLFCASNRMLKGTVQQVFFTHRGLLSWVRFVDLKFE